MKVQNLRTDPKQGDLLGLLHNLNERETLMRKLYLKFLAFAGLALSTSLAAPLQSGNACETCVQLDPGSAIVYGCMGADEGSNYCFPTDQGCYMGSFCYVSDDECVDYPWLPGCPTSA
jgi:hypothetical protein